jgi:hypothetical protein
MRYYEPIGMLCNDNSTCNSSNTSIKLDGEWSRVNFRFKWMIALLIKGTTTHYIMLKLNVDA